MPIELDELERRRIQLEIEREALRKETDDASKARLEALEKELADISERAGALKSQWEQEKGAIAALTHTLAVEYCKDGVRVNAVSPGPTKTARFVNTPGGAWWADAKNNYGLAYDVSTSESLTLPADPGLTVTTAQKS